jgi:hypothetical protein
VRTAEGVPIIQCVAAFGTAEGWTAARNMARATGQVRAGDVGYGTNVAGPPPRPISARRKADLAQIS